MGAKPKPVKRYPTELKDDLMGVTRNALLDIIWTLAERSQANGKITSSASNFDVHQCVIASVEDVLKERGEKQRFY